MSGFNTIFNVFSSYLLYMTNPSTTKVLMLPAKIEQNDPILDTYPFCYDNRLKLLAELDNTWTAAMCIPGRRKRESVVYIDREVITETVQDNKVNISQVSSVHNLNTKN